VAGVLDKLSSELSNELLDKLSSELSNELLDKLYDVAIGPNDTIGIGCTVDPGVAVSIAVAIGVGMGVAVTGT
jgi:hypothetical protein